MSFLVGRVYQGEHMSLKGLPRFVGSEKLEGIVVNPNFKAVLRHKSGNNG